MWSRSASLALILAAAPVLAQEGDIALAPEPEWLSETLLSPHGNIASSALPSDITEMPIGAVSLDAVGLLTPVQTGLPADLWAGSDSAALANLFRAQPTLGLPAVQDFTTMLALAELNPPPDSTAEAELFLARLDMLLSRGAIDPARALMERAGPTAPQVFRRWFDVTLLTDQPDRACAAMRANPDIAPSFPARIFCLARSGDWSAAALTLGTGEALGFIPEAEVELITRFLDPELAEGEALLQVALAPSPLHYVMRVAIGERPGAGQLPLAFAHADLGDVAGWRAQLDAAERLARAGAITPDQWQLIYTSRVPSASGGVWDRVAAVQAFDVALLAQDTEMVARTLPDAWDAMHEAGLEVAFAEAYARRLLGLPLTNAPAQLAREIALLSREYETVAQMAVPQSARERFLFAIARGQSTDTSPDGMIERLIADVFSRVEMPQRYASMVGEERIGEALLRASLVLSDGADPVDLRDALALFRALGLESVARRAALQMLLLDLRG
ncbi:MAG: hypothetical protein COW55_10555 [Rhodobacteraceae bacterium CG17_big_fil_post_rev_8_21_14_2_50_65_11]|nr:MAG: hypothetical protein COW55_10555 [Rhodobacteraceae bacterium CG17_big_fil_post_rev_8_21_14_2_50_65_11]